MQVEPKIFKSYDIRGIYPTELNEDFAYSLGRAYATLLSRENPDRKLKVVVGRDMRSSSPSLKEKLVEGLISSGIDVVDIGLSSTPTFYFAVSYYNYDGGLQVSASHNPGEYNGFKMTRSRAIPISGDSGIFTLRDLIISEDYITSQTKGSIEELKDIVAKSVSVEAEGLDLSKIKPLKIVVDTANAMGIQDIKSILNPLNCEVIYLNSELDGTFPNHLPNPMEEENNHDIKSSIIENNADLGISIDGDADRYFFFDEKGDSIRQDVLRGIIAQSVLRDFPKSNIAYDIRPGKITLDMILECGGSPVVTRVGHSLIKEKMLETDSIYGGESSGHYFFKKDFGTFEMPTILTYRFLEFVSKVDMPLSEAIKPYLKYPQSGEINSKVENPDEVFEKIKIKYSDANNISILDGLTVEYPNFWFNVRGSNTEHGKLRLNLEANNQELMEQKRDEVLAIINEK